MMSRDTNDGLVTSTWVGTGEMRSGLGETKH
jgi:hypothetical protein